LDEQYLKAIYIQTDEPLDQRIFIPMKLRTRSWPHSALLECWQNTCQLELSLSIVHNLK